MPVAYCNRVLDHPIGEVWHLIRDFDNYPKYIDGVTESHIEDGRSGDTVGAVRSFRYGDATIRQRLAALSDDDHYFTYVGMDPFEFPGDTGSGGPEPIDYQGTLRLTEVVEADRTFVEWSVSYEGSAAPEWTALMSDLVSQWVDSLRRTLADDR